MKETNYWTQSCFWLCFWRCNRKCLLNDCLLQHHFLQVGHWRRTVPVLALGHFRAKTGTPSFSRRNVLSSSVSKYVAGSSRCAYCKWLRMCVTLPSLATGQKGHLNFLLSCFWPLGRSGSLLRFGFFLGSVLGFVVRLALGLDVRSALDSDSAADGSIGCWTALFLGYLTLQLHWPSDWPKQKLFPHPSLTPHLPPPPLLDWPRPGQGEPHPLPARRTGCALRAYRVRPGQAPAASRPLGLRLEPLHGCRLSGELPETPEMQCSVEKEFL